MNDVKFGDLVARMAISLAVVLGLMYVAYRILKRRQSGAGVGGRRRALGGLGASPIARMARSPRSPRAATGRPQNAKRGMKIVARAGLSKTSSVMAVQFGEKVFMVGASDQGPPSVLAEIDLEAWTTATLEAEEAAAVVRVPVPTGAGAPAPRRPSVLDALREMTARRA